MKDSVKNNPLLEEKARLLPATPGCYLMKNQIGQTIYVGKAKNLKSRVMSYFNQSLKGPKTEVLVSHIVDFDFILTENDAESFVLENNLIKKFAPKYNIRLKDDKTYPYVVINTNEPFPRLEFTRKVKRGKGVEVYGPFVTGSNISEILRVLTKSFSLRDCSLTEFKRRIEPCLLYQMKQCTAPCVGKISKIDYEINLNWARDLFFGKGNKAILELESRMMKFAIEEEFEKAGELRDFIKILVMFANNFKQVNAELNEEKNLDFIAFYEGELEVDISLYMMRNGILLGHKNFNFGKLDSEDSLMDTIANVLFQYYTNSRDSLPERIFTTEQIDDEAKELLESGLAIFAEGKKIKVTSGNKLYDSLLNLTSNHAFEQQRVRSLNEESVYVGLNKLKDLLHLKERPVLLECFDVAVFQGSSPTASQIVFHDGRPDKKQYRHYHLQELPEGNNDFFMMKELITRRIDNGNLPDVFIVDGGLGQVNIFKEVLKELKISIPVIGIAKSKVIRTKEGFAEAEIKRSEERLIIPGRMNPYMLNQNRSLYKIIVQMRDEAHRFSRRLHHKQESKRVFNKKETT